MGDKVDHLMALTPGTELEDYRIERELGNGSFGITYLARDVNLDEPVAIKEYMPREVAYRGETTEVKALSQVDTSDFEWGLQRFLDEARVLANLRDPSVVRVRRLFRANNTAYIVMDYYEGRSLHEILERSGTLSEDRLQSWLRSLLDALEHIHSKDIVHRDIKPENIFVRDEDDTPVLLDFGAARQAVSSRSGSATTIATAGYGALEQYSSTGALGPWTDIYGLAATLYRCVTGDRPPDAPERVDDDPLIPASQRGAGEYSASLLEGIDTGLRVFKRDRPQTVAEWRQRFGGELAFSGAGKGPTGTAEAPEPVDAEGEEARVDDHVDEERMVSDQPSEGPKGTRVVGGGSQSSSPGNSEFETAEREGEQPEGPGDNKYPSSGNGQGPTGTRVRSGASATSDSDSQRPQDGRKTEHGQVQGQEEGRNGSDGHGPQGTTVVHPDGPGGGGGGRSVPGDNGGQTPTPPDRSKTPLVPVSVGAVAVIVVGVLGFLLWPQGGGGGKDNRFAVRDDGTVVDTDKDLQWMQCRLGADWEGGKCVGEAGEYSLSGAKEAARELNQNGGFAGYEDWRLPEIDELRSLVYCSNIEGAPSSRDKSCDDFEGEFDTPASYTGVFPNTGTSGFWSKTRMKGDSSRAWQVSFYKGAAIAASTTLPGRVRLVRETKD